MKNHHRLYEINPYEVGVLSFNNLPFLLEFEALLDFAIDNIENETDPRLLFNMAPEPYRPTTELMGEKEALRQHALNMVLPNIGDWQWLYENLEDRGSKTLLLLVLAYRGLGWKYITLPLDNEAFSNCISEIGLTAKENDLPIEIKEKGLQRFTLSEFERDITVYSDPFGIFNEFIYPQYSYRGIMEIVKPHSHDYVIDCGACFGGTTLNFADMVGPKGRVYSFEFMPDNINVYNQNITQNVAFTNRISLHKNPVFSHSNLTMYISGEGPATQVHTTPIDGAETVESVSIDDFVINNNFNRMDYIKMDIEGAEMDALKGSIQVIEKFRPTMAICVYHKLTDFYEVPRLLKGIHEDYKIYFGHSTVHGDESVIFAV